MAVTIVVPIHPFWHRQRQQQTELAKILQVNICRWHNVPFGLITTCVPTDYSDLLSESLKSSVFYDIVPAIVRFILGRKYSGCLERQTIMVNYVKVKLKWVLLLVKETLDIYKEFRVLNIGSSARMLNPNIILHGWISLPAIMLSPP